jgi:hypothetical protein
VLLVWLFSDKTLVSDEMVLLKKKVKLAKVKKKKTKNSLTQIKNIVEN